MAYKGKIARPLRLKANVPEIKSFNVSFHGKPECPVLNQVDRILHKMLLWIMISNANGDRYLLNSRGFGRFQQVSSISFIIIYF